MAGESGVGAEVLERTGYQVECQRYSGADMNDAYTRLHMQHSSLFEHAFSLYNTKNTVPGRSVRQGDKAEEVGADVRHQEGSARACTCMVNFTGGRFVPRRGYT